MNILAHALLAAPDDDRIFGSLIGDFVRGAIDPALPSGVREGIVLHRAIDTYTDAHPEIAAARPLFEPPFRRYAGIMLDMWFDHLLAREWRHYGDGALDDFSRRVRSLLDSRRTLVPARMHGFVAYLHAHDLPAAYRDTPVIGEALGGISSRLTRPNPLRDALPVLVALDAELQARFDRFFPQLHAFARMQIDRRS
ncbi:MAG TPA: ACP phosphodiesterase [Rhodanobacteraceae bacterium]|jgi:acyl carrier protein phosphodiesterase|nr:ACP phosphodiesterase [Rhodanobacteraceae bacterium]